MLGSSPALSFWGVNLPGWSPALGPCKRGRRRRSSEYRRMRWLRILRILRRGASPLRARRSLCRLTEALLGRQETFIVQAARPREEKVVVKERG